MLVSTRYKNSYHTISICHHLFLIWSTHTHVSVISFVIGSTTNNLSSRSSSQSSSSSSSSLFLATSSLASNFNVDSGELPIDLPRQIYAQMMLSVVRRACQITIPLQPIQDDAIHTAVQKKDLSPVTVADYAVQAFLLHTLQHHFPHVGFIAEEDSTVLRQDPVLCQQVALSCGLTPEQVLHAIDLGKSYQDWDTVGSTKRRPALVFCLDPIDGTRGFLRGRKSGGQYAIALALLESGIPVIGVLGCPNLPVDDATMADLAWKQNESLENNQKSRGCVFVAVQGGGSYQLPLIPIENQPASRLQVTTDPKSIKQGRFCIGVEKYSDAQGQTVAMAQHLQGTATAVVDGIIVRARRMDSQVKHGVIARGGAEWYVRLPKPDYIEWIWDHAAGYVVVTEAGGEMTDTFGRPIDFGLGAQLSPTVKGVLMSSGGKWHTSLVQAYLAVAGVEGK